MTDEMIVVTLVHIKKRKGNKLSLKSVFGNKERHYYLPGKSLGEVEKALMDAGFKRDKRILDAASGAEGSDDDA